MRKGLLGALALLLGNSAAQAQYYWPAQRPYGYAPPAVPAVMVAPPGPAYYAPRAVYPTAYPAAPNYLPQGYFPAGMAPGGMAPGTPMQGPAIVREGPATPLPAKPNPNAATATASDAGAPPSAAAAPEAYFGAGLRYSLMPQPSNVVDPARE